MNMIDVVVVTPIGTLGVARHKEYVDRVRFLDPTSLVPFSNPREDFLKQVEEWFSEYFSSTRPNNVLPLLLNNKGTPYQRKVWRALSHIPFGQTITYGELAEELKTSAQAVGMACKFNPMPILIPCHRVVARNGLGGFFGETSGKQIDIKAWLIDHEKSCLQN
jgi:methylated-DNA-[protein]-cysteine S-methyltransferase